MHEKKKLKYYHIMQISCLNLSSTRYNISHFDSGLRTQKHWSFIFNDMPISCSENIRNYLWTFFILLIATKLSCSHCPNLYMFTFFKSCIKIFLLFGTKKKCWSKMSEANKPMLCGHFKNMPKIHNQDIAYWTGSFFLFMFFCLENSFPLLNC